jgi:transcriptional regulator with XRE-family HTH domain
MSSTPKPEAPFKSLGNRLKIIRQKYSQTLAEVSGAVEIEEGLLGRIEAGVERPPEDILELLIDHFDIKDKEAIRLWTLAGYEMDSDQIADMTDPEREGLFPKNIVMLLASDTRTVYTDSLDIHYDDNGLLFNFKQVVGQSQPTSVAKLGMSYEQAVQVQRTLQKVLLLRNKHVNGPRTSTSAKPEKPPETK